MVLVLQHMLIALIRSFRTGQQVFLRAEDPLSHSDAVQDALLQLASVTETRTLRNVIKEVLESVLPKVENVFIYLLDPQSGRLLCEDPPHELLAEGKLSCAEAEQDLHPLHVCISPSSMSLCGKACHAWQLVGRPWFDASKGVWGCLRQEGYIGMRQPHPCRTFVLVAGERSA
ncbi:cGMP-dependent 3',5'-cyclic phosphodiesterase isoform X1 [Arapaima gigas]